MKKVRDEWERTEVPHEEGLLDEHQELLDDDVVVDDTTRELELDLYLATRTKSVVGFECEDEGDLIL